ncbi:MAG: Sec-independent protein translocase subunit TatC, partial [Burkholderiaceae bacterium]
AAFVVAAIVTPPDVISQLMLAIPLCLLYQLGLVMAKWVTPKEKLAEQEAEAAADAD